VAAAAKGVDLLVHEALSAPLVAILRDSAAATGRHNLEQVFIDIVNYHSSPQEAAEVAEEAQVGYLLLNHIVPPLPLPGLKKEFLGDAGKRYSGPIQIGEDGDFISLPAGSKRIDVSRK
jgi:ribonuclease Z